MQQTDYKDAVGTTTYSLGILSEAHGHFDPEKVEIESATMPVVDGHENGETHFTVGSGSGNNGMWPGNKKLWCERD